MNTCGLRSNNSRQVRYLLARLTGFVETACDRGDEMRSYLDSRRPFEIEHIWANHFDRYQPETRTRAEFDSYRNRLGALLLLRKSDNASYQDLPYEQKVDYYQRQNHLAGSLHPNHRERNPGFNKFVREHKLDRFLRPFPKFDKKAIRTRQDLYQRLCEIIWDPSAAFGDLARPAQRPDRSRTRTRARYDVAVTDLIAKGLLPPRARLVGRRWGEEYQSQVLDDGRIRVGSGKTFGSLSAAGEFVLQTKSCPGWNFWRIPIGDRGVRLVEIRREALERGLV
ncbi:restriction system modified-DNA reader domain-containing protein [Streptomyces cyslabdanicus]|uniref:restriction system modified-DNA reader domain-containing protein n=1 Tax=Streptomyces cyslabdanicus TaxID=1470456 RepID=UPI0040445333